MAETDNLKLTLPGSNEYADVEVLNENFRKIDAGTAPSGYGLGSDSAYPPEDDADKCLRSGWYATSNMSNAPFTYCLIRVDRWYSKVIFQTAYQLGTNVIARRCTDGSGNWLAWEYVNPPLAIGVEYRTTERYEEKAVYKKLDTDGVIKWRLDGDTTWHTDKPISKSVTLSASGWDSSAKTQTVTVQGVLAGETAQLITPTPALASQAAYYDAVILCTGQAADKLTFTAKKIPADDLTVYVTIQGVGA